jgi:hypothetical protein
MQFAGQRAFLRHMGAAVEKANNVIYSAYTLFELNQSYQLLYKTNSSFRSIPPMKEQV